MRHRNTSIVWCILALIVMFIGIMTNCSKEDISKEQPHIIVDTTLIIINDDIALE